ncbi:MAG: hypothetical protein ACRDRW_03875 [Pseudonocardiaceae bacterium]
MSPPGVAECELVVTGVTLGDRLGGEAAGAAGGSAAPHAASGTRHETST